jgi:hypothetical protein
MWRHDYRDIVAGGFFLVLGLAAALHAAASYKLGTLRSIGPGMFPTCIGVAMAVFGLMILIPAFGRAGIRPKWEPGIAAAVLASVAAFSAVLPAFGLVPATFALTFVARLAEPRLRPGGTLALATALSLLTWAVFVAALGVPLPPFRWPW